MTVEVVQTPPATIDVETSGPVSIEVQDTIAQQVDVVTVYNPTSEGIWIQTGLGPNGDDWTIWFEDGE